MEPKNLDLHLATEKALIRSAVPSERVLEISVKAPPAHKTGARPPLNLALVLDRSGSMSGEKLEYAKKAAVHALGMLSETDSVAVVIYDDQVDVLCPIAKLSTEFRAEIKQRVTALRTGGSTNLGGGWLAGCEQVASAALNGSINRALLLSDGLANVGITDQEELARHARALHQRGVSTSTFGIGLDFNEHLLEAMSNAGGGDFYYIASPEQIPQYFLREFEQLTSVTAREAAVKISLPQGVNATVLGGWITEEEQDALHIKLGDLYAGQELQVYVRLLTPPGAAGEALKFDVLLSAAGEDGQVLNTSGELRYEYAADNAVAAAPIEKEVMKRYAAVRLANTASEALKMERAGQRQQASEKLSKEICLSIGFMVKEDVVKYRELAERMKRGMQENDRKMSQYNSYKLKRTRREE